MYGDVAESVETFIPLVSALFGFDAEDESKAPEPEAQSTQSNTIPTLLMSSKRLPLLLMWAL